jgi:hypothetical protein
VRALDRFEMQGRSCVWHRRGAASPLVPRRVCRRGTGGMRQPYAGRDARADASADTCADSASGAHTHGGTRTHTHTDVDTHADAVGWA